MLPRPDVIRLRHMLEAAQEAAGFAAGRTRDDLHQDTMFSFALIHAIEIIGEAASQVSAESRQACPDLYLDINLDRVWETVTDDLPPLAAKLEAILREQAPKRCSAASRM